MDLDNVSIRKDDTWFLGVDLGTGSCKSVIVDEKANVLGSGLGEYSARNIQAKWEEQEPEAVLDGMIRSIRKAIDQSGRSPKACAGMSIGGALHSLMALDSAGNPLTGIITWADGRATKQAQSIRKTSLSDNLYQQTGCPVHGIYPLYKIMWMREEAPDVFQHASKFITAKEYVISRLTGQYVVDYCLAAGSGLLNTHTLRWNSPSLELAGITQDQLSPLYDPSYVIKRLDQDYAKKLGIHPDTPLVLGSADATNSNLGAGAVKSDQATLMVGTSGALRYISPHPVLDPQARSWCYAIDSCHWLIGGAINNGGIALSWLRDILNRAYSEANNGKSMSFEDLIGLAVEAGVGAGGLICLPFLAGERSTHWNLNARALFLGMSLHHDIRHLSRAILEGIAFQFRNLYEVLVEIGADIRQIHASGGFANSSVWLQIMTDVLAQEILVPAYLETSSLGAAFWAMLGNGSLPSLDKISELVTTNTKYNPNLKEMEIYWILFKFYNEVYEKISSSFDQLAQIQETLNH